MKSTGFDKEYFCSCCSKKKNSGVVRLSGELVIFVYWLSLPRFMRQIKEITEISEKVGNKSPKPKSHVNFVPYLYLNSRIKLINNHIHFLHRKVIIFFYNPKFRKLKKLKH